MTREEAKAAVGKSISFRPYSLYKDAEAFGRLQAPARSISAVVCDALEFYLEHKGFQRPVREQLAELVSTAQQIGVDEALRLLRRAARRPTPGRKEGGRRT